MGTLCCWNNEINRAARSQPFAHPRYTQRLGYATYSRTLTCCTWAALHVYFKDRYDATWEIVMHLRLVPPQDPVRLPSSAFLCAQLCVSRRRLPLLLLGAETFLEVPLHLYVMFFGDVP